MHSIDDVPYPQVRDLPGNDGYIVGVRLNSHEPEIDLLPADVEHLFRCLAFHVPREARLWVASIRDDECGRRPPVDNAHVTTGCEQFSDETIADAKANEVTEEMLKAGCKAMGHRERCGCCDKELDKLHPGRVISTRDECWQKCTAPNHTGEAEVVCNTCRAWENPKSIPPASDYVTANPDGSLSNVPVEQAHDHAWTNVPHADSGTPPAVITMQWCMLCGCLKCTVDGVNSYAAPTRERKLGWNGWYDTRPACVGTLPFFTVAERSALDALMAWWRDTPGHVESNEEKRWLWQALDMACRVLADFATNNTVSPASVMSVPLYDQRLLKAFYEWLCKEPLQDKAVHDFIASRQYASLCGEM